MYTEVVQKILKEVESDAENILRKLGKIKPSAKFTKDQSRSLNDLRNGLWGWMGTNLGEAKNEFGCGCKQEFESLRL